jgi:hypothetical protein
VLKDAERQRHAGIVAENLTQNTGGRYDVMNTSTALPEKMKALGEKLALDHRNMRNWYEVDIQTDSDVAPIDVAVAREGVRLQILQQPPGAVGVRSRFSRFPQVSPQATCLWPGGCAARR